MKALGFSVGIFLAALMLVVISANAFASQEPTTVPVHYEPTTYYAQEPVAPDKSEFTNPVEKVYVTPLPVWDGVPGQFHGVSLPKGTLLPFPEAPDGGVYESALTRTMIASREITTSAWRYDSGCFDFVRWSGGEIPVVPCSELRAYLESDPDGDGFWTPERIEEEISIVRHTTSSQVVDANGENAADIPSYSCDRGKEFDPIRLCQLASNDTRDALEGRGAPEEDIDDLVSFVATYAITVTVTTIDWNKVQEQEARYQKDVARIIAHNDAVRAANRYTVYECDATCEDDYARQLAAYETALADYEAGTVLNQGEIDDYTYGKAAESGMYVDCRLNRCVVVNSAR